MLPKLLDAMALVTLLVTTLVTLLVPAGMALGEVSPSWGPLLVYAAIGLVCGWVFYLKTVSVGDKPVSQLLAVQSLFSMLVAAACFVLGFFDLFGFQRNSSVIAGIPFILFALIFLRRIAFSGEAKRKGPAGMSSLLFLSLGYLWMAVIVAYLGVSMVGTFMINHFEGVSLLFSPLNFMNWGVILLWFIPGFIFRAIGNSFRGVTYQ